MSDFVKAGDKVTVKVMDIDEKGRVKLSRKAILPKPANAPQ